jgi:hypothetical protein
MQRVSGVSGLKEAREVGNEQGGDILPCLKLLMRHRYGDLILLCTVVAAFAVLLVVSAMV